MKLFQIAMSGIRGRKKDTRLLVLAVTLTFFFLTMSTTMITSMNSTREQQRLRLYGDWKVVAGDLTAEESEQLMEQFPSARCSICGTDKRFGLIGVCTDALAENGTFQILEGNYPATDEEVLLEASQLAELDEGIEVGDTIQLSLDIELTVGKEGRLYNAQMLTNSSLENERRQQEARERLEHSEVLDDAVETIMREWAAEDGLRIRVTWRDVKEWYEMARPEGSPQTFEELTKEEQRTWIRDYLVLVMLPAEYEEIRLDSIENNRILGCRDVTVRARYEGIRDLGTYSKVTVTIQQECVLAGIIESRSDLWNVGTGRMPDMYVTQGRADLYEEALQMIYEEFPLLAPYDGAQDLLFFRDPVRTPEELYLEIMPAYNALLDARETQYDVQYSLTNHGQAVEFGFLMVDAEGEVSRYEDVFDLTSDQITIGVADPATGERSEVVLTPEELYAGTFELPYYGPPAPQPATEEGMRTGDHGGLRINRNAYPLQETGEYLVPAVVAGLFLTAVTAVLQIFITQIRRRTRRIAILKALGMVNAQVGQMLFYEFLCYLGFALPLGSGLGLVGAYAAWQVTGRSQFDAGVLRFVVEPAVLGFAVGAGTLALFLGMAVPGILALRVPLSGRMEGQTHKRRRPAAAGSVSPRGQKDRRLTVASLARRNLAMNRGRTLGHTLLSSCICILAVLCTYMGYASFENWRTDIQWADRPDYVLTLPAALNSSNFSKLQLDLKQIEAVQRAEVICAGHNVPIWFEGIDDSALVQELRLDSASISKQALDGLFTEKEDGGVLVETDFYALSWQNPMLERLLKSAEGEVDRDAFYKGEEAILFVPIYHVNESKAPLPVDEQKLLQTEKPDRMKTLLAAAGRTALSARGWMRDAFSTESRVGVGDTVTFQQEIIWHKDDTFVTELGEGSVRVGAVVYAFEDQGFWPLTEHMRSFALIGSEAMLKNAYPSTGQKFVYDQMAAFHGGANEVYYQDTMGRTYLNVYVSPDSNREDTDLQLADYAREHAMELTAYRESSQQVYEAAQNNRMLAVFLGVAAVLLAWLILENSVASALEAERGRMGILQSMGITKTGFLWQQLYVGLLYTAAGILAAHVVWFAAAGAFTFLVGGSAIVGPRSFFACLTGQTLWLYPWGFHLGITALIALSCLVAQVWPMTGLLKYKPTENIAYR